MNKLINNTKKKDDSILAFDSKQHFKHTLREFRDIPKMNK